MQLIFRARTILALAGLLLLASCSKTNKEGKLVPKDAAFVLHINGESLSSKLPWDEIKQNPLFQKMYADSSVPAYAKKILDNPESSGIDIKSDVIIFGQQDSIGGVLAIEGSIKDAEKFKLFNVDASKGGTETEKDGIHYISRSSGCVGWSKEKFVYTFDFPPLAQRKPFNADTTEVKIPRDIVSTCKMIFDLKEKNSLGDDERFTSLVHKSADVHFWLNTELLYKEMLGGMGGQLSMFNMDKFYEGNIMTATANFENGKIDLVYKTYVGKAMKDILKKYSGGKVDAEMLKRIPSKDVAVALAMHFKPEMFRELINLTGMEGMINIGLVMMGFSLDDIIKATNGDFVIAVSDLRSTNDSMVVKGMDGKDKLFNNHSYDAEYMAAVGIGNKDAFNQILKASKRFPGRSMDSSKSPIAFNNNDKYFAIGKSKENVDKFLAGPGKNDADFISHITGDPVGGYINLQYIIRGMENQMTDSLAKLVYDASLKMWENIYIKGGNYDDGGTSYSFEINLLDKNTNSLKQLNQYLGVVGQHMLQHKEEMHKKMNELMNNKDKVAVADTKMEEIKKEKVPPPPPPPVKKKKKK